MPLVTPSPVPGPGLPLPTPVDLTTWGARMQELHTWLVNVAAPGQNALSNAGYQNALHAQDMAGQSQSTANFKGEWSTLTGALNVPASVSHLGYVWLLKQNVANVATETPGVSSKWLNISNAFSGYSTLEDAKAAILLGRDTAQNLIVNGDFRVNQRGFVSGGSGSGATGATLDRWHLLFGGTLTFSVAANGTRELTVPSSGLSQFIRANNTRGSNKVLSWDGTATATVNGFTRTNGVAFYDASDTFEVRFASGTLSNVMLEEGDHRSQYMMRPYPYELALCKAHYERFVGLGAVGLRSYGAASDNAYQVHRFVEKVATPTLTKIGTWTVTNCGQPTVTDATAQSCIVRTTVTATGSYAYSTGAGQGFEVDAGY